MPLGPTAHWDIVANVASPASPALKGKGGHTARDKGRVYVMTIQLQPSPALPQNTPRP